MQKHLALQVEPCSSLGFDPARNESCVNLESRKAKRRLYIPGGLLVGDPDDSFFCYTNACFFPESKIISAEELWWVSMLLQAGSDTAAPGREPELAVSRQAGWNQRLHCKSFADSSFLYNTQGDLVLVTSLNNPLNQSFFSNLFSPVPDVFSSPLICGPTWEHGCYRMFSTSLRQAAADWGSHFTQGNYLRFSESLLTVGKDCFSLWECQLEPFITWMTCNVIKTPARTHSVLSRQQFWHQCLSFEPSDSSSSG